MNTLEVPTPTESAPSSCSRQHWGERDVSLELLKKFTKPGDPRFGEVQQVWNYRGDCTETGDRFIKNSMGPEGYEHLHWDAVACTGGVLVVVPRWKFSGDRGESVGLPAPYWWAMDAIGQIDPDEGAGIRPCTAAEIAMVVPETQQLLSQLPGVEYMHISRLSFYSTGKRGKQWQEAPTDARFFRFSAGYGCIAIPKSENAEMGREGGEQKL